MSPPWAEALADAVQKAARAQARLGLQLEELERKLEGGFADLRSVLRSSQSVPSGGPTQAAPEWGELLDAMDLLEEAIRLADPSLAPGLQGVASRIERALFHAGMTRLVPLGQLPDGRLFRVVGTEPRPGLTEGSIARVVRAAVLQGEALLREGEAITVRNRP